MASSNMRGRSKAAESVAEVRRLGVRVSVRFNYVIFPLDVFEFNKVLLARQFAPLAQLSSDEILAGPDSRLEAQGAIARKGQFIVDVNSQKQFFGVAGQDPKGALAELTGILDDTGDSLDVERALFFELQARYKAYPKTSAMDAVMEFGRDSRLIKEASKALGLPLELFSARLVSGSAGPNEPDYFEVWVQPSAALPEKELGISVLFRNSKLEKFRAIAEEYEAGLSRLLKVVLSPGRKTASP